jgi:hypothetical protein
MMGGCVGVAVGTMLAPGIGAPDPIGSGETEAPVAGEAGGVAGGLVIAGAGGFTCARGIPAHARAQAIVTTAVQSGVRGTYAILASVRLTAEASNVL